MLKVQGNRSGIDKNGILKGFIPMYTVPLGDWLEKKKVKAIIIKQQFGFPIRTGTT